MKKLCILKIGGSVITQKNRENLYVYKRRLSLIAKNIKNAIKNNKDIQLILIHGAGSAGHQLASKYNLRAKVKGDNKKVYGSLISRVANQNLNNIILDIFIKNGLNITTIHTPNTIIQDNKDIKYFNLEILRESLRQNYIPLLHGDMVFDKELGMSICSGDTIAAYLAKELEAVSVFFASDIDGVFDKNPHKYSNAKLIEKKKMSEVFSDDIKISKSHRVDTTDGLLGKIKSFEKNFKQSKIKKIVIFNGTKPKHYQDILIGKNITSTEIDTK